jgi:hypothetical protein
LQDKEATLEYLKMDYEERLLFVAQKLLERDTLLNECNSQAASFQEKILQLSRPGQDDKMKGMLTSIFVAFFSGFGLQSFAVNSLRGGFTIAVVVIYLAKWLCSGGDWVPALFGTATSFIQLVFYLFIELGLESSTTGFVLGLTFLLPLCYFGIEESAKAFAPLMALACGFFGGASMRSHSTGHPEPLLIALGGAIGFGIAIVYLGIDYPAEVSFFIFSGGMGMKASTAWLGSVFWWQPELGSSIQSSRHLAW